MEDSEEYKNGFPKIEVTKSSVLNMLAKVAGMKIEERDLALDRFNRLNEEMATEEFWIQGKTLIAFLDSASKASNYLGDMAKDVMKLTHKDDAPSEGGGVSSDEDKRYLAAMADSVIREKRMKEQAEHKEAYNRGGEEASKEENPE